MCTCSPCYISLAWPDPFSRRALSIRDDKRPCEKGPVQFAALTRPRASAWWHWALIEIHKSNCVTVDYRQVNNAAIQSELRHNGSTPSTTMLGPRASQCCELDRTPLAGAPIISNR